MVGLMPDCATHDLIVVPQLDTTTGDALAQLHHSLTVDAKQELHRTWCIIFRPHLQHVHSARQETCTVARLTHSPLNHMQCIDSFCTQGLNAWVAKQKITADQMVVLDKLVFVLGLSNVM